LGRYLLPRASGWIPPNPATFIVETLVYDRSKTPPVQFSVVCFLANTKCWEKVKTPPSGAFLSVAAKLAGRTVDTNRLAVRVLGLAYLPRPNSGTAAPSPTTTPLSDRSRRDGRAPSTLSKRPRTSGPVDRIITPSNRNTNHLRGGRPAICHQNRRCSGVAIHRFLH